MFLMWERLKAALGRLSLARQDPQQDLESNGNIGRTDLALAGESAPPIDLAHALERMGGDRQLFSDVIHVFLEDGPGQLAAIKAAVDARDADAIRRTAHALKGASGNLAATDVFEAAQTLERLGAERRLDAAEAGWRRLSAAAAQLLDTLRRIERTPV